MPTRQTQSHRFEISERRSKPEARITPTEATAILGSSVSFSAAASVIEGTPGTVTYSWDLISPEGSSLGSAVEVEEDGSVVRVDGDVTGTYLLSLVVFNSGVASESTTAAVFFSPVIVPAIKRVIPSGRFMFQVLSNFWALVNDNDVFPVLWSSYTQSVASDLLQALQVDRAKSIRTIQPLFQKRWIAYKPALELDHTQLTMLLGNHQSGEGAFTGEVSFVDSGIVVSSTEFLLLAGTTSKAVGSYLTVYEGNSAGSYLINRINSSGNGYIISASSPFPSTDVIPGASAEDLVCIISNLLEVSSLTVDFVVAEVSPGDILRINEGVNAGYYTITNVGTPDGLSSDRHLEVSSPLISSASNMKCAIFRPVRASYLRVDNALTNTVYIPRGEADLDKFTLATLSSTTLGSGLPGGEIISDFEITINAYHVLESALGAKLTIKSGPLSGHSTIIADFNESLTGFVVATPFGAVDLPSRVEYEIEINSDVSNRLLILEGEAHRIAGFSLLEGLPSAEEGGRGDLWAVLLESSSAPSRREGMQWRIGSTIASDEIDDFETYGVRDGDLLELEIIRPDIEAVGLIYARVTGAQGNEFSIEIGTDDLVYGLDDGEFLFGEPSTATLVDLGNDLSLPTIAESSTTGEAIFTSVAFDIRAFIYSNDFTDQFFNSPIQSSTPLNVGRFFNIQIRPTKIIRNTRVALDPEDEFEDSPVFSIPALYEYISPEQVSFSDGVYRVVAKDMFITERESIPAGMVENGDYTVGSSEVSGAAASTTAGSFTITLVDLDLVANDVRVGDTLVLESGASLGSYPISAIVTAHKLRVGGRDVDASLPIATEAGITYRVERRVDGNFIRFIREFTPKDPAPETLWAPLTLIDNFKYIEDNFGVLVGTTKKALDEYGTTQISFKSAITGLMYAWTRGPTFRSVEIGSHILLDLPVTEERGEIIDVTSDYSEDKGRILFEDVDSEGIGKGIYRSYLYRKDNEALIEKFNGLGINPTTGSPFKVGDVVERFIPLSNSIVISDRIKDPQWWSAYSTTTGADELQKYHTWQAEFDLQAVDSRDLPLATSFLMQIRPIYTKPKMVGVLALLDEIGAEDSLLFEMDMFLFDDPAFSIEASFMVDSMSCSASARVLDAGSYSVRTFFMGDDLSMVEDSSTVISSRGGFIQGTPPGTLPYINSSFTTEVPISTARAVRTGDVLLVVSGRNKSRFIVTAVTSDTQLEIGDYTVDPPIGIPIDHIRDDTDARFYIQRKQDPVIVTGTTEALDGTNVIEISAADGFLWSDGVTTNDVIILEYPGGVNEIHEIAEVGWIDVAPIYVDTDTKLTLFTAPTATVVPTPFRIERRVLLVNPVYEGSGDVTGGDDWIDAVGDVTVEFINPGDRLLVTQPGGYADINEYFKVMGVGEYEGFGLVGKTRVFVDRNFSATDTIFFSIIHSAYESDEEDSDYRLERLSAFDAVDIDLYKPVAEKVAASDYNLSDDGSVPMPVATATEDLGVDLVAAGVQVGMWLEVALSEDSRGVYEIIGLPANDTVEVSSYFPGVVGSWSGFPATVETASCRILEADPNFNVSGDSVDLAVPMTDTLEDLGIRPGDMIEIDSYAGGSVTIIDIAGNVLTLAVDTGLAAASTGRIFRRERP